MTATYTFKANHLANGNSTFALYLNGKEVELFFIAANHKMFSQNWSDDRILSYLIAQHNAS